LPDGGCLESPDLKREHKSHLRSPLIAGVFYRRGLIEQWGRGTQKIVDWCVAAGQPEPEFEERAGAVVVRFRPSGYHPPLRVSHNLTDRQRRILQILGDRAERSLRELHDRLPDAPARRTLQAELHFLRGIGLIASSGRGISARWRLLAAEQ
jgi:ATP-dependent DNA helicase RecG